VTDHQLEFAEWLHEELVRDFAGEIETWALSRIQRVQERLNQARDGFPALTTTILWIAPPLAFTLAGHYVYIARSLLERLPTDDAVAFVLGHEAGHHDLGHLDLFGGWTKWLPETVATEYVAGVTRLLEHRTYGPAREQAADEFGISISLKAGYNPNLAIQALAILEQLALDRGDVSGVFGPENLLDPTDPACTSSAYRVERWLWTHVHGYLPLHERAAHAREFVRTLRDAVG